MLQLVRPALAALLLVTSLSAQTIVDDFSNGNDWVTGTGSGSGAFSVTDGKLQYTAGSSWGNSAEVMPSSGGNFTQSDSDTTRLVGYLNQSWFVQVKATIPEFGLLNPDSTSTPRPQDGSAQGFMAQLIVNNLANGTYDRGVYIQAGYDATWGQSVQASSGGWGNLQPYIGVDTSGIRDVLLRAEYDAASHFFTASVSLDDGANWVAQTSFNVTGPTNTALNTDSGWDVSADFSDPVFGIALLGVSHNLDISGSNSIVFDDFTYSGLSDGGWPAGPAIPEPSTYAALAGVAVLGLAFWRKRRAVAASTASD